MSPSAQTEILIHGIDPLHASNHALSEVFKVLCKTYAN